jgi:cobyrinic acid a,c-diamide synthase
VSEVAARPVIAVAGGPAFSFSYAETVELLTAAGADMSIVDPLRDEKLPEGCRGLVVDGAPMCGVIDTDAEMTPSLTLGYQDAVAASPNLPAPALGRPPVDREPLGVRRR